MTIENAAREAARASKRLNREEGTNREYVAIMGDGSVHVLGVGSLTVGTGWPILRIRHPMTRETVVGLLRELGPQPEPRWQIAWDNGRQHGTLPEIYRCRRDAERSAVRWKRDIVRTMPSWGERKAAKLAYQWVVVESRLSVEEGAEYGTTLAHSRA